MPAFSIIICTYNPDPSIFVQLLNSISNFDKHSPDHEIIIVDNNSNPSIGSFDYIHEFILNHLNCKLIIEGKPGLTNARIAGINEAKAEWLIFFDDDNEPSFDYLVKTAKAINQFPEIGAWGASEIEVEFVAKVDDWVQDEKLLFQQRNDKETMYAHDPYWQVCYPYGTGLILNKDIAEVYVDRVRQNRYTLSDRKGKDLTSGGDVQMVLTAVEQGLGAGIISGLHIKHIIIPSKATLTYLQNHQYSTASIYVKAHNQVFQDALIHVSPVSNSQVFLKLYSLYRIHFNLFSKQRFFLLVASKLGELNARVLASGSKKPLLLRLYEFFIDV